MRKRFLGESVWKTAMEVQKVRIQNMTEGAITEIAKIQETTKIDLSTIGRGG